jgi:hypothetical protein
VPDRVTLQLERAMFFTPNFAVGAGFILLGLVLLLDRMDVVDARALLPFWPVLLILFGASVAAQALAGSRTTSGEGSRQADTLPLVVLLVLTFIFVSHVEARRDRPAAPAGTHAASLFTVMGRGVHVAPAGTLHGGEVTTLIGRSHLDLRQAVLEPGSEAVVDILGWMGRVDVTVPPDWAVEIQATSLAAAVRSRRTRAQASEPPTPPAPPDAIERADPAPGPGQPPRLVLRGLILIGALVVQ